jgi:NADPH-dependent 2,4-dienoyl-CoA reductase/sulfur reductase-like enzyme
MNYDLIIIGGGAAGIAALKNAYDPSLNILLVEREKSLGGILKQCIHNGFGVHHYNEELTGPEYAVRGIESVENLDVEILTETTVIDIEKKDSVFNIRMTNTHDGEHTRSSKSIILSSGCYERTRGAIQLPGDRPAGIMPAGSAQRYLNMEGYLVGKKVFILGSGDIGLIMARRMKLEGTDVLGVAEIMPYSNGLTRNIVQCLHDFDIPLYLSHTISDIRGKSRLEGITLSEVDEEFNTIEGTEKDFDVDTLLLSVGLIPDINMFESLSFETSKKTNGAVVDQTYQTSVEGLFACGNALHVHDLADFVTEESEKAGKAAKTFLMENGQKNTSFIDLEASNNIGYVLPQKLDMDQPFDSVELSFRVTTKGDKGVFVIHQGDQEIMSKKARFVVPAEMEKITLKRELIDTTEPISIRFEVTK